MSDQQTTIAAALVKAWAAIRAVGHDRSNDHFRSRYTTYDAIVQATRPILPEHGLAMLQLPGIDPDGRAIVRNTLVHESGEVMDLGAISVPVKKDNDPQAFGSAMTYAKRYAWCAALGVPTGDDDDANGAAAEPKTEDPRRAAMAAIQKWTGLNGTDLTQAAGEVARMAGSKDPEQILAFVRSNQDRDFMDLVTNEDGGYV